MSSKGGGGCRLFRLLVAAKNAGHKADLCPLQTAIELFCCGRMDTCHSIDQLQVLNFVVVPAILFRTLCVGC
jgi:hypothetical protein